MKKAGQHQVVTIPVELVDLNRYVLVERANKFGGAKIKKNQTEVCRRYVEQSNLEPVDYPVRITFLWLTKDKRKDPDNVCFAKKFILDGLVRAGVLPSDGRKWIKGFKDDFGVNDPPRVEVYISPASK